MQGVERPKHVPSGLGVFDKNKDFRALAQAHFDRGLSPGDEVRCLLTRYMSPDVSVPSASPWLDLSSGFSSAF